MSSEKRPKFIIDLDTGVDDAMGLLVALQAHKKGDIDLLGITTVSGNAKVDDVIRNTFRILELTGCTDIPVFKGSEEAMVVEFDRSVHEFHGSDGFNDVKFDDHPDVSKLQEDSAIQAIHNFAKKYPGEVTLITLAPLTNLALAVKANKKLASNIKDIFIMGGNMEGVGNTTIAAEFNFLADPEAAYVVLNSFKCPIFIVTWEMCFKNVKPSMSWRNEVLGKIKTPVAEMMNRLEQVWFDNYEFDSNHWIMCDQFAVIAALDRSSITASRDFQATVELGGHYTRGQMLLEQRVYKQNEKNKNVTVIDNMDMDKIYKHLIDAFHVTNTREQC